MLSLLPTMASAFSRRILLAVLSLWLGVMPSVAQDADVLIAAGRFHLTQHDPLRASGLFQQAAESSPPNHEANALSALTRLAALPYRPAISNFLDRLTVPIAGRDIYNWTAQFPQTPDGKLSIPSFLKTTEVAALLRTELLGQIGLSIQELSRITNTAFVLNLSKEETTTTDLVADVADLRLCQALLEGAKVGLLSIYPWEFDASLSELADLFQGGSITAEEFARRYPTLYATIQASDGSAGRTAFLAAVEAYNQGIALIQQRPAKVVRLFNLSPDDEPEEQQFRVVLNELKASLAQPTVLSIETNLTVSMGEFFSAKAPFRSYLPELVGNGIVSGSWPDTNFGGILLGADLAELEDRYPPEYIQRLGVYRGSIYPRGIHVMGQRAFVAIDGNGLLVLNVSNPSQPFRIGGLDTPGRARGIRVAGNLAYVADDTAGLQVIDISDPSKPVRLGGYDTSGQARAVAVLGTTAFVADADQGLQLVDVSNPAQPVLLGTYDTSGNAEDVQIVGSTAFVADGTSGLQLLDISNQSAPRRLGSYVANGPVRQVRVAGDYAYLATDRAGLLIVDISTPTQPRLVGTYPTREAVLWLELVGNYVFLAGASSLKVFDVSDPASPKPTTRYELPTFWSFSGVGISGDRAYLLSNVGAVEIVDVSMFTAPPSPPVIQTEPQDVETIVGQSVQFSVTATGTEPFTYQWQHNSQDIPAATGPTFSIASVQLTNAGDYRVIVGNFVGNASSRAAKLTAVGGNVLTPAPGFLLAWDGNDGDGGNPVGDNLATKPGVTVITSNDLGPLLGLNYHLAANVNDGLYGNANSWISGFGEPAYAAVVFPRPSLISGIAFGRDNLGEVDDRCLGIYTIQFTKVPKPTAETGDTGDAASGWQTIGTVDYLSSNDRERGGAFTAYLRHKYEVGVSGGGPLTSVTAIRIIVPAAANQALDEVEVFGDSGINPADPDNDGFDTDVEVALGYDPKNTASSPSGVSKAETAFEFSFYAARQALYRIETSPDLKTWTTLEDNISGTGGEIRRLYSMRGQSRLHYRAVLRP